MKIQLLCVGKTSEKYLQTGISLYIKRLQKYCNFSLQVIPDLKNSANLSINEIKLREGELILQRTKPTDAIWLFDENGKQYSSAAFADFMQKQFLHTRGSIILLIGGAYGFSEAVYGRAQHKISLSAMTFSHQMVRLLIVEQMYRGFTILNNEPYHHI